MSEASIKLNLFENKLKKPLSDYKELKERILKECEISEATLNRWLKDDSQVPKVYREKIAQIFNCPVTELFPDNN